MSPGHLYLVGFMGAGKSTIGPLLGERLQLDFVDLDAHIVAQAGMPISRIFGERGEKRFRDLESRLLFRVSSATPSVIGLGGGAFMSGLNRKRILQTGISIWLKVSLRTALGRCQQETGRPLAMDFPQFQRLYRQRRYTYQRCEVHVSTDGRDPEGVCNEVVERVGGWGMGSGL